jgi:hypothetical protein
MEYGTNGKRQLAFVAANGNGKLPFVVASGNSKLPFVFCKRKNGSLFSFVGKRLTVTDVFCFSKRAHLCFNLL